ncbi:MAG: type II secretion system protein [Candidatus Omnitrophica bacterium]|nr:type II secretion system protein [Candidatus Omnitrophota bacterium]
MEIWLKEKNRMVNFLSSKKKNGYKKGFTLLELVIVLAIIGQLATLSVTQYVVPIEKAREAEARQVLGQIRTQCAAIYMGEGTANNCTSGNLRIGTASDMIPSRCCSTNYFYYDIIPNADGFTAKATRCASSGKTPNGITAYALMLATNFSAGLDTWTTTVEH